MRSTAGKPASIDEYLARLDPDKRGALQKLRKQIKTAAPGSVECIAYQLPAVRLNGKMLLAFGAAKNHCSFYPGSHPIEVCARELKAYSLSKGTIRFPADKPLPVTLVRKLVKAAIERGSIRRK